MTGRLRKKRRAFNASWRRVTVTAPLCALLIVTLAETAPARAQAATSRSRVAAGIDPASLVDTFVGTGSAPAYWGAIDAFPGADVPFGMVQWSPDTSPDRAEGGGYDYADDQTSGFSLTHLSGAGCAVFGDVPILPFTGALPENPAGLTEPFSHADEHAAPGRYEVTSGSPAVTTKLSVTARSGIGTFTFPASTAADLLFKTSDSANGIVRSSVRIVGDDEILGSVTSGQFCGTQQTYTVYFFATFEQAFTGEGAWDSGGLHPGASACSGSQQTGCGAWVSFDTESDQTVTMKVGISYVSTANAALNMRVEDPGWSIAQVESEATKDWNSALGRITVHGGSLEARRTFYTALYHSLLDPSIFSDVNGQYEGIDGHVHEAGKRVQYANFSEWDIYRSEIPLLSVVDPGQVSDMMQSLVNDFTQTGSLPVWELANSDVGTMDGDSADPIIADAYGLGVRGFDAKAALTDMIEGATRTLSFDGVEERPDLAQFDSSGYIENYAVGQNDILAVGTSMSLEYAIDDFAIAEMAEETGRSSGAKADANARLMMTRAQDWESLFNPATGYLQARQPDGSFPAGPALQPIPAAIEFSGQTQFGFQEGNAIQYTWSVPQDLGELFTLMGGDQVATKKLDQFLTEVNAGPFLPYDWSGNEPDLWVPWEFDYSGAPWRTEQSVRQIASTMYSPTPNGEPGNDDLGAMSSWYVWADLGLYPLTPGTGDLVVGSPMFPSATVELGNGRRLEITASGAPNVYVRSATLSEGSASAKSLKGPWVPASLVHEGGKLHFDLGSDPDKSWGAGAASAPPSYDEYTTPVVGFTLPSGAVQQTENKPGTVAVGIESIMTRPSTVSWTASSSSGIAVSPSSGRFSVTAASRDHPSRRDSTTVHFISSTAAGGTIRFRFSDPDSSAVIPPVVIEVQP